MSAPMTGKIVHGAVTNIPSEFHSANLRNYFSQFIEEKRFECFHFRHRPEFRRQEEPPSEAETSSTSETTHISNAKFKLNQNSGIDASVSKKNHAKNQTNCCIVRLTEQNMVKLLKMYHKKPWVDKKGEIMATRCIILRIRVGNVSSDDSQANSQAQYQTRAEQKIVPAERETFTHNDLIKLAELQPPDIMPNGNIGTPTSIFLQFIRECRLPPKMIQKLGLTFPRNRSNKRYGNVPFDYRSGNVVEGRDDDEFVSTGAGHRIDNADHERQSTVPAEANAERGGGEGKARRKGKNAREPEDEEENETESEEDDDDDTCEEWERHEALHDDVTRQERNDERTFESEMEVTWDKGSSGLVFYTDAAYWKELEGDFDEQTTDDLDVDMSVYYDPDGGDKDARDLVQMRYEHRRRQGLEMDSVFKKGIGKFEKHTKGVGRKVMEKHGWKEGQGIGRNASGMADALDNEGQTARDKRGLGYHGEKLNHGATSTRKRQAERDVIITTIYDDPQDTDPTEPLLRSRGPYHLKYRDDVKFKKADKDDN